MTHIHTRSEATSTFDAARPHGRPAFAISPIMDDVIEETSLFDAVDDSEIDEIDDIVRCLGVRGSLF